MDPFRLLELAYVLEEATAKMRHDVRNKLSGMGNMIFYVSKQVMKTDLPANNPVVAQFLKALDASIHGTDATLDELTSITSALRGRAETAASSPGSCIEQAIEARRVPNGSIAFDVSAETTDFSFNPASICLALRALVENAVESSPHRGRVAISGRPVAEGYLFEVADRGPGIPDPAQAITPFYSTKRGHLGLGLGIARRIAHEHDGALTISGGAEGANVALLIRAPGGLVSGRTSRAGAGAC